MANEKDSKKESKNRKSFFKDFKAELKKVIWPTPKQLVKNTIAVVVIVAITATIVFVLDVVFDLFNEYGISNLKSHVRGNETVQIEENTTSENTQTENEVQEGNEEVTENVVEENNNAVENETISE